MTAKYFNSVGAVSDYAEIYPANNFNVVHNPQTCQCNGVRCSFDVTDKEDNDILEILVICPLCANNPKNRQ
jgi:hypothetical protein